MYKTILGVAVASLFLLAPAHAGDVEAGERKSQVCQACHGPDGNGIGDPQYPLLAGQYADYMEKTLRDYRSGARDNLIMAGFAATLSDQDIRDLSAFYAAQTGPLRSMRGTR
ncbi:c-type cytochrome [Alkalisalibacterium limincola]|uniref:Cytochrome c n=1 Tax=Alkalisalibacterium limincola TaxID=2699169 RepID=A0A5C8KVF0_9GAMM|nr:cytochrome c [Alkalisalibacterium limincola]TXK64452.1 cytochrome c [Alkalisalibacterium limincola]